MRYLEHLYDADISRLREGTCVVYNNCMVLISQDCVSACLRNSHVLPVAMNGRYRMIVIFSFERDAEWTGKLAYDTHLLSIGLIGLITNMYYR